MVGLVNSVLAPLALEACPPPEMILTAVVVVRLDGRDHPEKDFPLLDPILEDQLRFHSLGKFLMLMGDRLDISQ